MVFKFVLSDTGLLWFSEEPSDDLLPVTANTGLNTQKSQEVSRDCNACLKIKGMQNTCGLVHDKILNQVCIIIIINIIILKVHQFSEIVTNLWC